MREENLKKLHEVLAEEGGYEVAMELANWFDNVWPKGNVGRSVPPAIAERVHVFATNLRARAYVDLLT